MLAIRWYGYAPPLIFFFFAMRGAEAALCCCHYYALLKCWCCFLQRRSQSALYTRQEIRGEARERGVMRATMRCYYERWEWWWRYFILILMSSIIFPSYARRLCHCHCRHVISLLSSSFSVWYRLLFRCPAILITPFAIRMVIAMFAIRLFADAITLIVCLMPRASRYVIDCWYYYFMPCLILLMTLLLFIMLICLRLMFSPPMPRMLLMPLITPRLMRRHAAALLFSRHCFDTDYTLDVDSFDYTIIAFDIVRWRCCWLFHYFSIRHFRTASCHDWCRFRWCYFTPTRHADVLLSMMIILSLIFRLFMPRVMLSLAAMPLRCHYRWYVTRSCLRALCLMSFDVYAFNIILLRCMMPFRWRCRSILMPILYFILRCHRRCHAIFIMPLPGFHYAISLSMPSLRFRHYAHTLPDHFAYVYYAMSCFFSCRCCLFFFMLFSLLRAMLRHAAATPAAMRWCAVRVDAAQQDMRARWGAKMEARSARGGEAARYEIQRSFHDADAADFHYAMPITIITLLYCQVTPFSFTLITRRYCYATIAIICRSRCWWYILLRHYCCYIVAYWWQVALFILLILSFRRHYLRLLSTIFTPYWCHERLHIDAWRARYGAPAVRERYVMPQRRWWWWCYAMMICAYIYARAWVRAHDDMERCARVADATRAMPVAFFTFHVLLFRSYALRHYAIYAVISIFRLSIFFIAALCHYIRVILLIFRCRYAWFAAFFHYVVIAVDDDAMMMITLYVNIDVDYYWYADGYDIITLPLLLRHCWCYHSTCPRRSILMFVMMLMRAMFAAVVCWW